MKKRNFYLVYIFVIVLALTILTLIFYNNSITLPLLQPAPSEELPSFEDLVFIYNVAPVQLYGDINVDGTVNSADLSVLGSMLQNNPAGIEIRNILPLPSLSYPDSKCPVNTDFNQNHMLDSLDYQTLSQIVSGTFNPAITFVGAATFKDNCRFEGYTGILTREWAIKGESIPIVLTNRGDIPNVNAFTTVHGHGPNFDPITGVESNLLPDNFGWSIKIPSTFIGREIYVKITLPNKKFIVPIGIVLEEYLNVISLSDDGSYSKEFVALSDSDEGGEPGGQATTFGQPVINVPVPSGGSSTGQVCPQRHGGCLLLLVSLFSREEIRMYTRGRIDNYFGNLIGSIDCQIIDFKYDVFEPAIPPYPRRSIIIHVFTSLILTSTEIPNPNYDSQYDNFAIYGDALRNILRQRIENYREKTPGVEESIAIVSAHGGQPSYDSSKCGRWYTGKGGANIVFDREEFHDENYKVRSHKVCEVTDIDLSCSSGFTVWAVREVNNLGDASCSDLSWAENCKLHAGYNLDYALSLSNFEPPTGWNTCRFQDDISNAILLINQYSSYTLSEALGKARLYGHLYRDEGYGPANCQK